MKNFEAYETDIRIIGLKKLAMSKNTGRLNSCNSLDCRECAFLNKKNCDKSRVNWLYEEYQKPKIKIPLATKVILESLNDRWEWIAKDKDNCVVSFENKPTKGINIWNDKKMMGRTLSRLNYTFKNDLFDFLSWKDEEPTNIRELLENCEVINDE